MPFEIKSVSLEAKINMTSSETLLIFKWLIFIVASNKNTPVNFNILKSVCNFVENLKRKKMEKMKKKSITVFLEKFFSQI